MLGTTAIAAISYCSSRSRPCVLDGLLTLDMGSDVLEFQRGVADFHDAKAAQQRVTFSHNVNIVAVGKIGATGSAIGNSSVAVIFHIRRKFRFRRWRRWWRIVTWVSWFRYRSRRRGRRRCVERISSRAFVFGTPAGLPLGNSELKVIHVHRRII